MISEAEVKHRFDLWNQGYWEIPDGLDTTNFDFSWRPEPWDRPYIHQFGTQHQKTGGPRFVVPEYQGTKYQQSQYAIRLPDSDNRCWRPIKANATMDFSWNPDDTEPPFIYVFGNQWYDSETMPTYQYRVKGATEKKYITTITATLLPNPDNRSWRPLVPNATIDFSWCPSDTEPPFIYVFGNQWHTSEVSPTYEYRVKGATQKKYLKDITATLLPDINDRAWRPLVPNATIDFSWKPPTTDPLFIYVFGNQWYKAETMPTYEYRVKGATEKKYINDITATLLPNTTQWDIPEYISDFDYSWVPNPHEPPFIYQFGTEIHPAIGPRYKVNDATLVKRDKTLVAKTNVEHPDIVDEVVYVDSVYDAFTKHKFTKPFVHIKRSNSKINPYDLIYKGDNLLNVVDGVEVIVSRDINKKEFYDKITDYADINYHYTNIDYDLLDVVFFSNGEACAEDNYQYLLSLNLPNRIVRVDGVDGRIASQHAAANISNTSWYFLVNAKLRVNKDFDFRWQPDVLKSRRHYIFRATNPVNGLEYGHQAIVANNKILTLNTVTRGLDFTMDSPHEVVHINSGIGMYNTSIWDTWRTSFRECIKLCYAKDDESKKRLSIWCTVANGDFAEYSLQGAKDAVEYYTEVNGNLDKLKLSYDWAWLRERFNK